MLTPDQLARIMPRLPAAKAQAYLSHLNDAMAEFAIDNRLRTAAFAAQLAHESGEFRWMEEIWGPTDAQRRYEPPLDIAKRLGNTQPGDGKRFKGRGPIQLTGRANYQRFGDLLGIDLVGSPEQAADPSVAFRVAALFWKNKGLNELADAEDFREITRRINGGFNGLDDRLKYYERAKAVLADGFEAGPAAPVTRGGPPPAGELERGAEAIGELAPATAQPAAPAKAPARKAGAKKAPAKKTAAKKTTAKKAAAKKAVATKAPAKKAATKKAATKKAATKKAPAKKAPARKASARKAPTAKSAARKAPAKKAPAGKTAAKKATATKAPAKKAPARKAAPRKAPARGR